VNAGAQTGSSIITLWVVDTGGRSNSASFKMTVLPLNTDPVISTIVSTNILANQSTPEIPFTVYDLETPSASLTVAGFSGNTALVPNGNIIFGGSGSNRTVSITPVNGQTGVAPIIVSVSDGTNTSSSLFTLMVLPSADVLFYDTFPYNDGPLVTNSAFLWTTRSGTPGECQVINGQLEVRADQTEDVIATLIGSPYARSDSTVLYASFKFKALGLPKKTPGYFARFSNGSANRGRVYVGTTTNAPDGSFSLFVSNGSDDTTILPDDLYTNTVYLVVTRYEVDTAITTLWLNPASESDPNVTASDVANIATISYYGFRQDSSVGTTILVDDLRVGLSFSAVVTNGGINPIPLNFQRVGAKVVLSWSDPAFVLQSAPFASGAYTNISGASSPYTNSITQGARFFRLLGP
jgi:hypothetical protein